MTDIAELLARLRTDRPDTQPILGGDTAVTLTSAATLASLGVTVTTLGAATLDASGAAPVAVFPITGGTDGPGGADVILHQGSGLKLADASGSIAVQNFRIDTQNAVVDADVTVNGIAQGNVGLFDLGSDGTLTLTAAAAGLVGNTLGTGAITDQTPIGSAAPAPVTDPFVVLLADLLGASLPSAPAFLLPPASTPPGTAPIIGGATAVTLSAAGALDSLGVKVSLLGSATLDTSGADPVATFPITGGTVGPGEGIAVILHQGSGLELSDAAGTVDIRNLLIDTANTEIDADLTLNGHAIGNAAVFDLGADGLLTLTAGAATALNSTLGTDALNTTITIGTAATSPLALPSGTGGSAHGVDGWGASVHCA
jgi:hypothetical protein